jgi:hypothetical protein
MSAIGTEASSVERLELHESHTNGATSSHQSALADINLPSRLPALTFGAWGRFWAW